MEKAAITIGAAVEGAPLPATAELHPVLIRCKASETLAKEIVDTLTSELQPVTIYDFACYFCGSDLNRRAGNDKLERYIEEVSERKERWTRNGPLKVVLGTAIDVSISILEEAKKIPITEQPTKEADNEAAPLDPDVNKSLKENWRRGRGNGRRPHIQGRQVPMAIPHRTGEYATKLLSGRLLHGYRSGSPKR